MTYFTKADAPAKIAKKLIPKHHKHLEDKLIVYVFRDDMPKKNGKLVLGRAKIVSGLNAWLYNGSPEPFHMIEFTEEWWKRASEDQREALVDHELCHLEIELTPDEDTGELIEKPKIRAHDVEEFTEILDRHGLWKSDVEEFVRKGAKQLTLALEETA